MRPCRNIADSCGHAYSLVSSISAGLGIGFGPQRTQDLLNRVFEMKTGRGSISGSDVARNQEDPTASREDIADIAGLLARRSRSE
jgi:hypothetical protein